MEFPRFNLSKFENATGVQRRYFSEALDTICSETGFVLLEGHGVPEELIQQQWRIIGDFFFLLQAASKKGLRYLTVVIHMVGLGQIKKP